MDETTAERVANALERIAGAVEGSGAVAGEVLTAEPAGLTREDVVRIVIDEFRRAGELRETILREARRRDSATSYP